MRPFVLTVVLLFSLSIASCTSNPSSGDTPTINYPSVDAALSDLQSRNNVTTSVQDGFITITEADGLTMWSFAAAGNPAYPAMAKRVIYQDKDGWHIKMAVRCEAEKPACAKFEQDFEVLNDQMRQALQMQQQP